MSSVLDFIKSALPWVVIGLFLACTFVVQNAKMKGDAVTRGMKILSATPTLACLLLTILDFADGKSSSATVWLVIAIGNLFLGFYGCSREEKEQ